jgi:hypothetical protein
LRYIIKLKFFQMVLVCCVVLISLYGCRSKEEQNKATLQNIALEYWENRLVTPRDYQKSYDRENDKNRITFDKYKNLVSRNEKFRFFDLKTNVKEIEGTKGIVSVILKVEIKDIPVPIDRKFEDFWIYSTDSHQWRHVFSENQP